MKKAPLTAGDVNAILKGKIPKGMSADTPLTDDEAAAILKVAKADNIVKVGQQAAKVAKARQLSPAFDAECAAAEAEAERVDVSGWTVRQHVMHGLGFAFGWLRTRWAPLVAFATLMWIFVKLLPLMWMMVKALAFLVPIWLILSLAGPEPHPYQAYRYRQYRRRTYGEWW